MLKLTCHTVSKIPLEVEGILPELVEGLSISDVARLPVQHGNRTEMLGEHFDVESDRHRLADIRFAGDTSNVKRIGERMSRGTIYVENNVGLHCGAYMTGGSIIVDSSAGDWLGAEMKGGTIEVRGSAGHQAGAAYRGSRKGMSGGTINILGNAGDELGLLMRRGLIVVGGTAGSYCGASMIAGTIAVSNGVGSRVGAGMKRGTIIVRGPEPEWHAGTAYACTYQPAYARLLERSIRKWFPISSEAIHCHRADLITGGRGEIWHLPVN